MRNFFKVKIFFFAGRAVRSLTTQAAPRLPPGLESGNSELILPRPSGLSAAGHRRTLESLFPAWRGRLCGGGLRGDEGTGTGTWPRDGTDGTGPDGRTTAARHWSAGPRQSHPIHQGRRVGQAAVGCSAPSHPKAGHAHLQQHAKDVPADDEQLRRGRRHRRHG